MGSFGGWVEPFDGRQNVKFTEYQAPFKENDENGKYWVLLRFTGENGDFASWDGNLFPDTQQKGRGTGNRITMRTLTEFFLACGLWVEGSGVDHLDAEITKPHRQRGPRFVPRVSPWRPIIHQHGFGEPEAHKRRGEVPFYGISALIGTGGETE